MIKRRTLRVLHVTGTLSVGGVESWLLELVKYWSKTSVVSIDILTTNVNKGGLEDEFLKLGVNLYHIPFGAKSFLSFAFKLRSLLRDNVYDAIHDHCDCLSGIHFLAALGCLPAVRISHFHNRLSQFETNYNRSFLRRLTTLCSRLSVRIIASHVCGTSSVVLKEFGFPPGSNRPLSSVLHCGVAITEYTRVDRDLSRQMLCKELGINPDSLIVFHAGRIDHRLSVSDARNHKNTWMVVQIARMALDLDASVVLVLAGGGQLQRRLMESEIKQWGLSANLRFVGVRRDIPSLMCAADIFLFPSNSEGLGMAAVEAQAAATPVLVSNMIPSEACVVPELYNQLSLQVPLCIWAEELISIAKRPRLSKEKCFEYFYASPFAIANSARNLVSLYSST